MIRIAETVNTLVMMFDDPRYLPVVIDLGKNPFANRRMLLHLSTLFQGESSRFLKKSGGKPHLSDVVDESAQMGKLLLAVGQPESNRNIP